MAQLPPRAPTMSFSWVDEFVDFTSTRRGTHRRSITFLEPPSSFHDQLMSMSDPKTQQPHQDDDPKRVKRTLANRQSAHRSRVKKLHYISDLHRTVTQLQTEVSALSPRVAFLDHQRLILNVDNTALKQRIAALAQHNIFKDAHQEALKNEIDRLRQIYHEQSINTNSTGGAEELAPDNTPLRDHKMQLITS